LKRATCRLRGRPSARPDGHDAGVTIEEALAQAVARRHGQWHQAEAAAKQLEYVAFCEI
jgi:hypothetical protein